MLIPLQVRALYEYSIATGLICEAMRNPSTSPNKEVTRAAKAQKDLNDLHAMLVWKHGTPLSLFCFVSCLLWCSAFVGCSTLISCV